MNELLYDIALSYDESITPIEKISLLEKFRSSREILELNINTLRNILGRNWKGSRFLKGKFISLAEEALNYINKMGIKTVKYNDDDYPIGLKNIPDFPFLIYYRGNINYNFNKSIAVVGTRQPDNDGLSNTKRFVKELVNNGFTIISGLAHGIDTSAHYNCLINNGKTIAVLGCGIDDIYPYANKDLAKCILNSGGCIISEYPPGVKPNKWNFPKRNRLIVGLSRAVLIVQAPKKSGSLITAMLTADYNRDLYVIYQKDEKKVNELGNIQLMFNGANVISNPYEIIDDLVYI
jgi:DNA processing protein